MVCRQILCQPYIVIIVINSIQQCKNVLINFVFVCTNFTMQRQLYDLYFLFYSTVAV